MNQSTLLSEYVPYLKKVVEGLGTYYIIFAKDIIREHNFIPYLTSKKTNMSLYLILLLPYCIITIRQFNYCTLLDCDVKELFSWFVCKQGRVYTNVDTTSYQYSNSVPKLESCVGVQPQYEYIRTVRLQTLLSNFCTFDSFLASLRRNQMYGALHVAP